MAIDAVELARRVREGEVTSEALVAQAKAALDGVDDQLRAVVFEHPTPRIDPAGAEGPFAGVPFVVKDLDGSEKGVPNTGSARFLVDYVPDQDSVVIARLRKAGFVFIARTSCPELGIMGTTESELRGPTHNPWKLAHTPGGSSGGTAALVAAGVVPAGHGGDGGGSLRIPASACGLVGLKPSRGRVPVEGGEGWGGFVQQGVITRSVRDTAAMLDVLSGPAPGVPYTAPPLPGPLSDEVGRDPGPLRVGFSTRSLYGRLTHADCVTAVEQAAALLEAQGHEVVAAEPAIDRAALAHAYLVQVAAGTAATVAKAEARAGRASRPGDWEPATWFLVQLGSKLSALQLQQARDLANAAAEAVRPVPDAHAGTATGGARLAGPVAAGAGRAGRAASCTGHLGHAPHPPAARVRLAGGHPQHAAVQPDRSAGGLAATPLGSLGASHRRAAGRRLRSRRPPGPGGRSAGGRVPMGRPLAVGLVGLAARVRRGETPGR